MPNADPTQAKTGDENEDTPAALTEERVAQIVNSAVTAHLKRSLSKEIGAAIAAALPAAIEPLKSQLADKRAEDDPSDKADKAKPSPELVALQKQLADMQAALKAKDEEATAERRKAREDKAFADLVGELTGKVRTGTERTVAKLLRADGQLVIDDEGTASLKVRTSLAKGQAEQDHEFPIADGVGHYLKTKDAELFLPPPKTGGAGGTASRVPPTAQPNGKPRYDAPPTSDEEAARRTAEQLAAMGVSLGDL